VAISVYPLPTFVDGGRQRVVYTCLSLLIIMLETSGQIMQAFQPVRVSTRQICKSPLEQRNGFADVADVAEPFKSVAETMGENHQGQNVGGRQHKSLFQQCDGCCDIHEVIQLHKALLQCISQNRTASSYAKMAWWRSSMECLVG
jgi:hypothetical protein